MAEGRERPVEVMTWPEVTPDGRDAAEPVAWEFERDEPEWPLRRWEQRLQWQATLAVGLLVLVLLAQRFPVGPMAGVAKATAWTMSADVMPAPPWQNLMVWLEKGAWKGFWEDAQQRLAAPIPVATESAMAGRGAVAPAAADRKVLSSPVVGPVVSHGPGGADLAATAGNPVRAMAAGVVRRVLPDAVAGMGIEVQHSDELLVTYRPLTGTRLTPGAPVRAGDVLGMLAGTAGTPSRLHLELLLRGKSVDPVSYMAQGA